MTVERFSTPRSQGGRVHRARGGCTCQWRGTEMKKLPVTDGRGNVKCAMLGLPRSRVLYTKYHGNVLRFIRRKTTTGQSRRPARRITVLHIHLVVHTRLRTIGGPASNHSLMDLLAEPRSHGRETHGHVSRHPLDRHPHAVAKFVRGRDHLTPGRVVALLGEDVAQCAGGDGHGVQQTDECEAAQLSSGYTQATDREDVEAQDCGARVMEDRGQ